MDAKIVAICSLLGLMMWWVDIYMVRKVFSSPSPNSHHSSFRELIDKIDAVNGRVIVLQKELERPPRATVVTKKEASPRTTVVTKKKDSPRTTGVSKKKEPIFKAAHQYAGIDHKRSLWFKTNLSAQEWHMYESKCQHQPNLTVLHTVYHSRHIIESLLKLLISLPLRLRCQLQFIFVDDGSPVLHSGSSIIEKIFPNRKAPIRIIVVQLLKDVGFNNGGARNTGVSVLKGAGLNDTHPVFFCDIDHALKNSTQFDALLKVAREELKPGGVIGFKRVIERKEKNRILSSPPNVFLTMLSTFTRSRGYDEDLSGMYGEDRMMGQRFRKIGAKRFISKQLLIAIDEGGSSTSRKNRTERLQQAGRVSRVIAKKAKDGTLMSQSINSRIPYIVYKMAFVP